jgi:hypothetical protein
MIQIKKYFINTLVHIFIVDFFQPRKKIKLCIFHYFLFDFLQYLFWNKD